MNELTTLIGASFNQRVGGRKSFRPYENQSGVESCVRTCSEAQNGKFENNYNMPRGKTKIPNELKSLRGTDQPCRMRGNNTTTTTAVTALPKSGLKGTAKKVFAVVATELINKNLLDIVGVDLVVAYAREMALYHDSMRDLETDGYTIEVETKNGSTTIINPKRKIAESALSNAKSLATEFGFTPASRNRVQAMLTDNKPQDDFADFEEIE